MECNKCYKEIVQNDELLIYEALNNNYLIHASCKTNEEGYSFVLDATALELLEDLERYHTLYCDNKRFEKVHDYVAADLRSLLTDLNEPLTEFKKELKEALKEEVKSEYINKSLEIICLNLTDTKELGYSNKARIIGDTVYLYDCDDWDWVVRGWVEFYIEDDDWYL